MRPAQSATPFRWLWIASTSGALADGIAASALPLLIVGLTRNPIHVALLQVASGLPWLLFGLHAGVLSDRWDRRNILVGADVVRAAAVAVLLVVVLSGRTSVSILLVTAFMYGAATVLFRSASPALLPSLLAGDDLARANSRLQTGTTTTGSLAGPSLGGVLFGLAAWIPLVGQLAGLIASVLALRRLPRMVRQSKDAPRRAMRNEIAEGLRWINRDPTLRALAISTPLLAASTGMLLAVLVLHVVEVLGAPQSSYGILFTLYAVGGLGAAAAVPATYSRVGTRHSLLIAALLGAVSLLTIAWGSAVVITAIGMALLGVAAMLYNIVAVTVRQQRTPDHLLGRVSSVFNVLGVGSLPPAALAAGVIASAYGTTSSIATAAVLCIIAAMSVAALVPRPGSAPADSND